MKFILVVSTLLCVSACTPWVELSSAGSKVVVVDAATARNCNKIGNVSAKTYASVLGNPRSQDKVSQELARLARNEAASISANALVAISPPVNGEQSFMAFQCK